MTESTFTKFRFKLTEVQLIKLIKHLSFASHFHAPPGLQIHYSSSLEQRNPHIYKTVILKQHNNM